MSPKARIKKPLSAEDASERRFQLQQLEDWLEMPMIVLSFVWLGLLLLEFVRGGSRLTEGLGLAIWVVFILEFALRLWLAPEKGRFLARNWLTEIALVVPAFRVIRVLWILHFARGLRVIRVIGAVNRSMSALKASMRRRGLGYVLALTGVVILAGAGGMLALEPASEVPGGFTGYGDALWWTCMLMTSIGSQFWPATPEGRTLCVLLSVYGFAVFGYITASFASFFVGRDAAEDDAEIVGEQDIAALRDEIRALRADLQRQGHA